MKSILIPMTAVGLLGSLTVMGQPPAPAAPPAPPTAVRARASNAVYTAASSPTNSSYVGLYVAEIDAARAKALKLREEHGVEVTKVEEEGPAAKAGIKLGDVVLDYNGQRVEGIEQFKRFVRETPANRDAKMLVSRDGNSQTVVVRVGARKMPGIEPMIAMAPRMVEIPEIRMMERPGMLLWSRAAIGIEADSIDGQLAQFFGAKEGVLVRSVMKGSAAEKAGLRAGDVVVKVDDTRVSTAAELTRAVRSARTASKKSIPVIVMRDRKEATVVVPIEGDDRSQMPGFEYFGPGSHPVGFTIRL